jgi:uncharacterized protein GlcG (DUF336 family)
MRSAALALLLVGAMAAVAWCGSGFNQSGQPFRPGAAKPQSLGRFTATSSMSSRRFSQTATLLRTGDVLMAGGAKGQAILAATEIYDPSQDASAAAANLEHPRKDHTATLLNDGTVLIVGGDDHAGVTDSAELFNPASGAISKVRGLTVPRTFHTATLLANGTVLIAGGSAIIGPNGIPLPGATPPGVSPLDTVEIYFPGSRRFFVGFFTMQTARALHTATAIMRGHKVLIAGGLNLAGGVEASGEVYDSRTGLLSPTGAMASMRYGHAATLLKDGRVLITGGLDLSGNLLATAEIYDPASGLFTPTTGSMNHPRAFHTATLLSNGKVLIVGGSSTQSNFDKSAELYDPASGSFTATATPTDDAHIFHTATLLKTGRTLVVGGTTCCASPPSAGPLALVQAELFSPGSASFAASSGGTVQPRAFHSATMLQDGRVFIAGGEDTSESPQLTAELYKTRSRSFSATGFMNERRTSHTASLINCSASGCPDGQVLLAGGIGVSGAGTATDLASAELYNPAAGSFTETGAMTTPRDSATATALADGRILVAGGEQIDSQGNTTAVLASAEIYDPAARAFTCVGGSSGTPPACNSSMTTPRLLHSATLLPDGTVLLTGGVDQNENILQSAEIFDPQANGGLGGFSAAGPATAPLMLNTARVAHTAVYLSAGALAGKVLIAGGAVDLSAELYDPAKGTFSYVCESGNSPCGAANAAAMQAVRFLHTATMLGNGMVLLTGGSLLTARGQLFPESSAELFDPSSGANGMFMATKSMTTPRALHTATLLDPKFVSGALAGTVLIGGGEDLDQTLLSAELFIPPR